MLKWDETKKRRKVNPFAGRRRRRPAAGADSPVTRGRRRRIPPIVEDQEEMVDSDATIIPSPQSIMADSPELDLAPPPLPATPVRRGPNIKYTKRKLALDPPTLLPGPSQGRKGPNIKYTKRKSPPAKKKSPPKKKKSPPKKKKSPKRKGQKLIVKMNFKKREEKLSITMQDIVGILNPLKEEVLAWLLPDPP